MNVVFLLMLVGLFILVVSSAKNQGVKEKKSASSSRNTEDSFYPMGFYDGSSDAVPNDHYHFHSDSGHGMDYSDSGCSGDTGGSCDCSSGGCD